MLNTTPLCDQSLSSVPMHMLFDHCSSTAVNWHHGAETTFANLLDSCPDTFHVVSNLNQDIAS